MELNDYLQKYFGFETFRPGQREIIEAVIEGEDVVALLPTGMGKSLCYQLPAYILNKPILIVSPLLSLMQDQVDQLKQFGEKRVVALNSFLTFEQKNYALHYLHEYRFIFTSPEMLLQQQVKDRLAQIELGCIVADEAHCISQWGFDFRPDYLRIGEFINASNRPPILALTATATTSVVDDIKRYLLMNTPYEYIHDVNRENIKLSLKSFATKDDKIEWIVDHVMAYEGPGIIYTQSRAKTESISLRLIQNGISAAAYHAGKEQQDRQFIQQQFLNGQLKWIVATNAFGMGVHKSNIRQVIHESMPSTVANYMQEIGRAGRDGERSIAYMLYAEGDEQLAKFIVTEDLPRLHHLQRYEQYRQNHELPKNMLRNGEISEVAFRVIDYWLQRESPSQLETRLQKMQMEKYAEVEKMQSILQAKNCMREQLIEYFGQKLKEQQEVCCSKCGFDEKEILEERQLQLEKTYETSWENRLQKLLFPSM